MINKKLFLTLSVTAFLLAACSKPVSQTSNKTDQTTTTTTSQDNPAMSNSTEVSDIDKDLNSIDITDPTQELTTSEK